MTTITVETDLDTISCGACGGVYAIQTHFRQRCQQEGKTWTCPYCKTGWGYAGIGTNAELQKKLATANAEKDRLQHEVRWQEQKKIDAQREADHFRRSRDAMKGVVSKIKKRVGNGVCPCCNRSFKDLARHMAGQHPEFKTSTDEES